MSRERLGSRKGPLWLRESSDRALHGIAAFLSTRQETADLTSAQEWLFDRAIEELEWRWTHKRPVWQRCSCRFCVPPFPLD